MRGTRGERSRDEKRHQEKKNKAQRAQRKKDDITRVRTLVDTALASDPRIKAFKAAEKAARDAKKGKVAGAEVVDPKVKAEQEKAQKEKEEQEKKDQAEKDAKDKVSFSLSPSLPFSRLNLEG